MAVYVYLDNYHNNEQLVISYRVFDQLVTSSLLKVKRTAKSQKLLKKNQFVRLNRAIQTRIYRDIVHISIYVDIAKGSNIQKVVGDIQDEVYNSLLLITEQVPVNIQVKVETII